MKQTVLVIAAMIVLLALGLSRLQLDADVFNLLPRDSGMVQGLQAYQTSFGSSNELLLLLQSDDSESALAAVEKLAADLEASGLASRVVWRNPFLHNAEEFGEFLAYLWLNQPPEDFAMMADRFAVEGLQETLGATVERMAVSFQPMEVARLGNDPFDLTALAERIAMPITGARDDPFASADGTTRIFLASAPADVAGFRSVTAWVADTRAYLRSWEENAGWIVHIRLTGNPAFLAESGAGLMRDVQLAAVGTLIMVAMLFWLVHRRWRPLLWLVALLTSVLAATVVAGGLIFGTLHAVALGFAAILLGLAADYALILYQESVTHPEGTTREHRNAVAPAVLWSSVTTATAFFVIGRSSLPGLTQLGVLVGIGILMAAGVMLLAYLPLARGAEPRTGPRQGQPPAIFRLGVTGGSGISLAALLAATFVLAWRLPSVETDTRSLQPNASESRAVLEEIRREIGGFDDDLWLIISAKDDQAVRAGLDRATAILDTAVEASVLNSYNLPGSLWPTPATQRANARKLAWLRDRWAAAEAAAREFGFVDDSLEIDRAVFAAWQRFDPRAATVWPESPGALWAFRQFAARTDDGVAALGRLEAPDSPRHDQLVLLTEELTEQNAGQLVSWTLLADSLLDVMNRDIQRVLIPMCIALLMMLVAALRRPVEVVLSVSALTLSLLLLLALMAAFNWSWNLMNVMALPMLFGASVDYGLHIQYAMRRYDGNVIAARNNVGRAILLCAGSTAAGFATLAFADNAGVASLGQVCAAGIVIAALVAVFLLPTWWRIVARRNAAA